MTFHLDTDFLVHGLAGTGPERRKLVEVLESPEEVEISAIVWYEYSRGPRTVEQLAVARTIFSQDGIVPFTAPIAVATAEMFRKLGSPRRRAADIAIGITAVMRGATLITRNVRDFAGIDGLKVEDGSTWRH